MRAGPCRCSGLPSGRAWGTIERIIGEGRHAASWVQFSEPGDQYPGLCFFDRDDDGRIASIIEFWPTAAELPASRAHLVERY